MAYVDFRKKIHYPCYIVSNMTEKGHFSIFRGYLEILKYSKNLDNGSVFRKSKSFEVTSPAHWVQVLSVSVIKNRITN